MWCENKILIQLIAAAAQEGVVECREMNLNSLREEAALQSGGTAVDTSVSSPRWQLCEQTVAGVGDAL